ncbi:MAG: hypothetical protein QM504_05225 [Pseudomonadota bacterium]
MKKITGLISAGIISIAASQFAVANSDQRVCLSNDALPKHCKAGDIIVVRPKEVATSCDFSQQIIKLKPSKESIEFLCRYTGRILKIRPNTSKPVQQQPPRNNYQRPPQRKKNFFW